MVKYSYKSGRVLKDDRIMHTQDILRDLDRLAFLENKLIQERKRKEIDRKERDHIRLVKERNHRTVNKIQKKSKASVYLELISLLDGYRLTGEIEIVESPLGFDQNKPTGLFQSVFIDKKSSGFPHKYVEGFMYGKIADKEWIKLPFSQ